jgi:hypothetical protein
MRLRGAHQSLMVSGIVIAVGSIYCGSARQCLVVDPFEDYVEEDR